MNGLFPTVRRFLFGSKQQPKMGWATGSVGMGGGQIRETDFVRQVNSFVGTVHSCVDLRATAVSSSTLRFFVAKSSRNQRFLYTPTREISKKMRDYLFRSPSCMSILRKANAVDAAEILEHPIIDLLTNVNNIYNENDLYELLEIYLGLTGNNYWYLPRNGLNVPTEIYVLPPQYMKVIPGPGNTVAGYEWRKGIQTEKFPSDEVIHFRIPSPTSRWYGRSPLVAVSDEYTLSRTMNSYEKAVLDNMGNLSVALEADKEMNLDEDEIDEVLLNWNTKYGGVRNARKVAYLQGVKVHEFGLSPRDLNFLQGRKWTTNQIANAYRVPISMLKTEDVNMANAKTGEYHLAKYATLPELRRIEQEMNQSLCPMFDDRLFVQFDDPVPEDNEFVLKELETHLKMGYRTINEKRIEEGLDPVPWGDEPFAPLRGPTSMSTGPTGAQG